MKTSLAEILESTEEDHVIITIAIPLALDVTLPPDFLETLARWAQEMFENQVSDDLDHEIVTTLDIPEQDMFIFVGSVRDGVDKRKLN